MTTTTLTRDSILSNLLSAANMICREVGLPEMNAEEFQRYYSVDPYIHGVNVHSPERGLTHHQHPKREAAARLSILWHEGAVGLERAEKAAGIESQQAWDEWYSSLGPLAAAAANLRAMSLG